MTWLIDGYIIYDENGSSITNKETNDTVLLPATASRLLSFLVRHHGTTLTRDEILDQVWDKYGYKASNNTLTQYISLIRKDFLLLGFSSDFIITIPRIGFVLTKEVDVILVPGHEIQNTEEVAPLHVGHDSKLRAEEPDELHLSADRGMNEYVPPPLLQYSVESPDNKFPQKVVFIWLSLFSLVFFLLAMSIFIARNYATFTVPELYKIGNIESCPVYMFYQSSVKAAPVKLSIISEIANKNLPCVEGSVFFAQPEDSITYGENGRVFLSRCAYQSDSVSRYSGCKNVYYYE